ncbi:MAG: hypothetical protein QM803_15975 [Rhodocyclaceae bacterium]
MKPARTVLLLALPAVLAACENSGASYQIGGSADHTISLLREQAFFWSDTVQQALVPANLPDCQRRYALPDDTKAMTPMDVFATPAGDFVVQQGSHWYAVTMSGCSVQVLQQAPQEMGHKVGGFALRDGKLAFEVTTAP